MVKIALVPRYESLEPHLTRPRAWKTTTDFRSYIHTKYTNIFMYTKVFYILFWLNWLCCTLYISLYIDQMKIYKLFKIMALGFYRKISKKLLIFADTLVNLDTICYSRHEYNIFNLLFSISAHSEMKGSNL